MNELAQRRGLKLSTLTAAGIERIDSGWLEGWYAIPYPNATGIHKWRYSNPQPGEYPKLRDDPGASFHLYNPLGLGPGEPEVWFAEGEFDTLCLVEAGLPALGIHGIQNIPDNDDDSDDEAPADSSRASRLNPNWRYLFTGSRVVVMLDNEEKSWAAGRKLANLLEGEVFDRWDDAYGDINEWWIGNRVGMLKTLTRYRYMT